MVCDVYNLTPLISIRTPRVGSDVACRLVWLIELTFQSALPVWGVTAGTCCHLVATLISIRTPRVGSDLAHSLHQTSRVRISIRTPRVGSDHLIHLLILIPIYFNPHSPCGE